MYWEEKIDLVKKKFPASDFKDPFREGWETIEKVIRKFHHSSPMTFTQTEDRKNLIKDCTLIKECSITSLCKDELKKLDDTTNYWLFLINMPMGSSFKIYDCRKDALQYILYLSSGQERQEFYIVHKKYLWATYFILDKQTQKAEIYKSGIEQTTFDK